MERDGYEDIEYLAGFLKLDAHLTRLSKFFSKINTQV